MSGKHYLQKSLTVGSLLVDLYMTFLLFCIVYNRAREIDKCKSVQPFDKQSAISVSFTETNDRPFPLSRNDRLFPDIR